MVTELVRFNGMQKFVEKTSKHELSALDVLQFSAAVLFFTKNITELQTNELILI